MPGATCSTKPCPRYPLFGNSEGIDSLIWIAGKGDGEASHFAECLGYACEPFRMVVNEPVGSPYSVVFFVREPHHHESACWSHAAKCIVAGDCQHHAGKIFHVDSASSPDPAVNNVTAEWGVVPFVGVGGDDVDVSVEEKRMWVVSGDNDAIVSASRAGC